MDRVTQWLAGDLVLGAFLGGNAVLVLLSLLVASAYRERLLLLHAAAMVCAMAAMVAQAAGAARFVPQALMLAMALACLHLRALTSHVGSLRQQRAWTEGGAVLIAAVGAADALVEWQLLPAGIAVWITVAALVTLRAWPQSQPWVLWTVPGHLALAAAGVLQALPGAAGPDPRLAGILAFWAMALYLASVWRSRIFGEDRSGRAMAETLNPLTGLSTPVALMQRVEAARSLMRRYGHPGSLLLVHVEHLATVASRLGAETAEAVALEAGTRVRDSLGAGDVGARLGFQRFAVLSEGTSGQEAAARLATRIVSSGLRAPLGVLPGNYLQFRVVISELPPDGVVLSELIQQLDLKLDADVARAREKRIRIVPFPELQLTTVPGGVPQAVTTRY